jgi:hypothetical protein
MADLLAELSDAAREVRREVTRRKVAEAFAAPEVASREEARARLVGAVARQRSAVGEALWARLEGALDVAVATGEVAALTEALDAMEAALAAHRVEGAAGRGAP